MARDKELLPRDLYDIVVARQRDPAALQIALDALRQRPRDRGPGLELTR